MRFRGLSCSLKGLIGLCSLGCSLWSYPLAWPLAFLPPPLGLLAILGTFYFSSAAPRALWLSDFLCSKVEGYTGDLLPHVLRHQEASTDGSCQE